MKFPIASIFPGILAGILLSQPGHANSTDYKGLAFDLKKQEPAYVEEHREIFSQDKHTSTDTRYLDNQGRNIAERTLDFSHSLCKPDYVLKDFRDGYEEGAAIVGDQVRVFVRATRNTQLKEKQIKVPEPCVIDGGFNYFLKQNWDGLLAGKRIHFNFVAPSQLDYFAFIAREDLKSEMGKNEKAFVIELENPLIRLLVAPIRVSYDADTRRMTQYQGISNVNDSFGKSLKVRLVYPELGP